jgi:hypothetical protein
VPPPASRPMSNGVVLVQVIVMVADRGAPRQYRMGRVATTAGGPRARLDRQGGAGKVEARKVHEKRSRVLKRDEMPKPPTAGSLDMHTRSRRVAH